LWGVPSAPLGANFLTFISLRGFGGVLSMRRAISIVALSRSGFFPMPNPWDIPDWRTTAEQSQDALYLEVGRALSAWEGVEQALADIFAILVGAPHWPERDRAPALRAFGTIIGFLARIGMLEAATQAYFYNHPEQQLEARRVG
jgi:hypothetical protein